MSGSIGSFHSISERIRTASRANPHARSMAHGDRDLSYAEVDLRADQFANHLVQRGIGAECTVAICMDRSFEWIIAALGILRVGGTYVPLDSAWPDARLRFALRDSGAKAVVGSAALLDRLDSGTPGIDPFRDAAKIAASPEWKQLPVPAEAVAYVIYTSGSTGTPKGVEITHRNLANLIDWHLESFRMSPHDRASHLAGLGFDAAVWEIWGTLACGACLCLPDNSVRFSPELIQEWMVRERITIGFVPTVHASTLLALKWPDATKLRFLLTGGDALPVGPRHPLPFTVVNNYGPTECTVVATSSALRAGASGVPTIGLPISGTTAYLLDEQGQPVGDDQLGELYIGGHGVGRGYRNLPDATKRSFLPDPFSGIPNGRMYRTGDCAKRCANGEFEFHGRVDRQVKIRGQRIELDEIGVTLCQHPDVQFAVAVAQVSGSGRTTLVSYVLAKEGSPVPSASEIQRYLLQRLPSYMVPATFLQLSEIPVSANGKLDLIRLPEMTMGSLAGREVPKKQATQVQQELLGIVQELLDNDTIGLDDNFFLAGGHSLLGMQLIMRLRKAFGVDVTLRQLFDAPTVEHLAVGIETHRAQEHLSRIWMDLLGVEEVSPDIPFDELSGDEIAVDELQRRISLEFGCDISKIDLLRNQTIRKQVSLLCGGGLEGNDLLPTGVVALQPRGNRSGMFWMHYPCLNLAKALGEERPFLCMMLTSEELAVLDDSSTLQQIASFLVPKILASQGEGPYVLGGYCLGGILSYEVACQLRAAGHEVSLLVLLDTPSPEYYRPADTRSLLKRPIYLKKRIVQLGLKSSASNMFERLSRRISRTSPKATLPQLQDERAQSILINAAFRYVPSAYDGKVALIMASELSPGDPPQDDFLPWWQSLVPKHLQAQFVKSNHDDLVRAPVVHHVANLITSHLNAVEGLRA